MATFEEHFERARQARDDRNHAVARVAWEAALSAAAAPRERALALNGLADTFGDNDNRAIELLDQAIASCLPQRNQDTPQDAMTAYALAQSWYDKAIILMMMRRDEDALAVLDEPLGRFLDRVTNHKPQSEWDWELCLSVAGALRTKSGTLADLDRFEEALACCDDLIRRFGAATDERLLRLVARATYRRGNLLGYLGRQDREVEAYDQLIARFGNSPNEHIIEAVLEGFDRKTRIYQDQEDLDMVIETCDDLIRRYGEHSDWHVADSVARAMIRRAVALGSRALWRRDFPYAQESAA